MMTRRGAVIAALFLFCGRMGWTVQKKQGYPNNGTDFTDVIVNASVFVNLNQIRSLTVVRGKETLTLDGDQIWKALHG
jgi:hypothetical protein